MLRRTMVLLIATTLIGTALVLGNGAALGAEYWGNGEIAFSTDRDGQGQGFIYVMAPDGSRLTRFTSTGPIPRTHLPPSAWSPDGTRLVHAVDTTSKCLGPEVFEYPTGVSAGSIEAGREGLPTWSPDGDRFAMSVIQMDVCGRGYLADGIWITDLAGLNETQVTDFVTADPDWSRDGTKITFTGFHDGNPEIYVIDVDGSSLTRLTNDPGTDGEAAWSPDGSRVAFRTDRDGNDEIYVMNADGSSPVRLTNDPAADRSPAWSPDGSRIAFSTDRDGNSEIYVMLADGSRPVNLTNDPATDLFPAWRPVPADPPGSTTVGLVDPATGRWHLRNWAGTVTSFFFGNPNDVPVMGDWNGDGVDTPGLFRTSDAFAYLSNANRSQIADIRFFFGNPSDIPLAGDWDGDGYDTLSIYRPGEQRFYIVNSLGQNEGGLGPADFSFTFGNPGDKPVVGDWDADGIDEVGLHRESTGFFYWRNTLDTGVASGEIFFGDPGDRFVAGDWGIIDDADTPAVFRPSNTTFYSRHTLTQGVADRQFVFGETPWLPVAGKFGLNQ